jgi:hypothetical protein
MTTNHFKVSIKNKSDQGGEDNVEEDNDEDELEVFAEL